MGRRRMKQHVSWKFGTTFFIDSSLLPQACLGGFRGSVVVVLLLLSSHRVNTPHHNSPPPPRTLQTQSPSLFLSFSPIPYTPSTSSFYIPHPSSAPESATPFTILVPPHARPLPVLFSPSLSPPFMIFLWHVCLFVSFINHPLTL